MALEIERKFLVQSEAWRTTVSGAKQIRQGYIVRTGALNVRIRTMNGDAFITIKNRAPGIVREEYEYAIPLQDAEALLAQCEQPIIEKRRHSVSHAGRDWSVDEFKGLRAGLVLAECELADSNEQVDLPDWIGREVTDDPAYRNEAL